MGSAETLLCWGGMVRTPFGWSLSEVDPLQFPNQGIPSAMSIHPVWLPFSSLGFPEEGLDIVACAPWNEGSGPPPQPPQGQGFGSRTSPMPGIPTASPSHLASTIWMAVQGLLSWKTVPGCPW